MTSKIISSLLFFITTSLVAQVNFTASIGNVDKEIKFHIDKFSVELKPETTFLWSFGDGETSTEKEPIHQYKTTGTYKVCLQIDDQKNVCKEDVFTVTDTGLKVKYVNDIIWPSGSIYDVDSPFSFRIKANEVTYDFHRALDIVGNIGDDIKAVADGVVHKSFGHTLVIKHKMDTPMYFHGKVTDIYYSMSLHLNERYVDKGDKIKQGDVVAALGNTNSRNYPHNHFEIRIGSYYSKRYLDNKDSDYKYDKNSKDENGEFIDPQINPLLFLDNAKNENNSLEYWAIKKGNDLYVRVRADHLEDHFNEIVLKHNSGTSKENTFKLNFNSRDGMPYLKKKKSGDNSNRGNNYDFDYRNPEDNFDIYPIKFKYRKGKDFEIVFKFDDIDFNTEKGDYIEVKDFYGNKGRKGYKGLVINEVNFASGKGQDYNFDGKVDENDDFIEIVNKSKKIIDISEYKIYNEKSFNNGDFKRPMFMVPDNTILYPGQVYLIFKAITKAKILKHYPQDLFLKTQSAIAISSDLDINEKNTESIVLTNKFNGVLDIVSNKDIKKSSNYSLERSPNLTGDFKNKKEKATPGKYIIE
ncbi:peptidoglycan DD-metalloendopeptidase family protein [Polaribacter porphyrae]|uniref:PKD domain-containing protein n=1 Tax=Polaribacter porphyrae TaxID=1137780 RepID=A0A2S7WQY9_9FLAO|nr:peptidoglycan DD-metalloendopeptidase family protein [Polaribacter porphyrae]PQJ79722.1 hypothetical protein BTO18_11300 [Polaribacter porphyrae]